jgi:hypothetical protein
MGDWGGCREEEIFGPATLNFGRLAELRKALALDI